MTLTQFLIAHTFIAGLAGISVRLWIAGYKLSTESFDSPRVWVRWLYRYAVFSNWYLGSFLLTPLLILPILKLPSMAPVLGEHGSMIYFVSCIPLAVVLYYLDYRFAVWCDPVKLKGRKRLSAKRLS